MCYETDTLICCCRCWWPTKPPLNRQRQEQRHARTRTQYQIKWILRLIVHVASQPAADHLRTTIEYDDDVGIRILQKKELVIQFDSQPTQQPSPSPSWTPSSWTASQHQCVANEFILFNINPQTPSTIRKQQQQQQHIKIPDRQIHTHTSHMRLHICTGCTIWSFLRS